MASADPVHYTTALAPAFEYAPVEQAPTPWPCPAEWRSQLMIDTVHDGDVIPPQFLLDAHGRPIQDEQFLRYYHMERDWGANLVAQHLAMALNLEGYHRVNIARVLMDYGRFPGMTRHGADHLGRFALNYPFSELLSYDQKRAVLEECYDVISAGMERAVRGKVIKIAIHTYDRCNSSGTVRPQISLVTRASSYQANSRMPFGVFDGLFPDVLGEFTCNRVLRDRISLTMEKAGLPVAHNYPYLLPEGSIEVRAQVWFFFDYLRRRFEALYPATREVLPYRMVWGLLMDTNLRDSESEVLRSYLHMFRRAPRGQEELFRQAADAYEAVCAFLASTDIVEEYRHSLHRPSCMGIEVRKDLVWNFDARGRPLGPNLEGVTKVAQTLARAIYVYLTEDRPEELSPGHQASRDAWYHGTPAD